MKRFCKALLLFCLPVYLLFNLSGCTRQFSSPVYSQEHQGAGPLPVYGKISPFLLKDQRGETFPEKFLQGKIWIADFIYARCTDECPMLSSRMAKLQKLFSPRQGVQLVSFTIDPDHDTPSVLTDYAKHFGAIPGRWVFLTGKPAAIREILAKNFHVALLRDPSGQSRYAHSVLFALVDQKGEVRGYYDLLRDPASRKKLLRDVAALAKQRFQ